MRRLPRGPPRVRSERDGGQRHAARTGDHQSPGPEPAGPGEGPRGRGALRDPDRREHRAPDKADPRTGPEQEDRGRGREAQGSLRAERRIRGPQAPARQARSRPDPEDFEEEGVDRSPDADHHRFPQTRGGGVLRTVRGSRGLLLAQGRGRTKEVPRPAAPHREHLHPQRARDQEARSRPHREHRPDVVDDAPRRERHGQEYGVAGDGAGAARRGVDRPSGEVARPASLEVRPLRTVLRENQREAQRFSEAAHAGLPRDGKEVRVLRERLRARDAEGHRALPAQVGDHGGSGAAAARLLLARRRVGEPAGLVRRLQPRAQPRSTGPAEEDQAREGDAVPALRRAEARAGPGRGRSGRHRAPAAEPVRRRAGGPSHLRREGADPRAAGRERQRQHDGDDVDHRLCPAAEGARRKAPGDPQLLPPRISAAGLPRREPQHAEVPRRIDRATRCEHRSDPQREEKDAVDARRQRSLSGNAARMDPHREATR